MKYIAFDVETPNYANDRMSAIGVSVIEDGQIVKELYTLINPEVPFAPFHISLTGITPQMVAQKPTFGILWPLLEPIFDSGILIAHNAPFDLAVLSRCLQAYGICWRQEVDYACTCQMGKRFLPQMPNHKLNTLCDCLGFELDHHNAGSDSRACAKLLMHYLDQGADIAPFVRRYDLQAARTISRSRRSTPR